MPKPPQYSGFGVTPLGGGLHSSKPPKLIEDNQSPAAENVDFDISAVSEVRGAAKLGNRPMPKSGIRTTVSRSPLKVAAGRSVPVRGYAIFPYAADIDLGGDFASDAGVPPAERYHTRRGKLDEWSLKVSFKLPETEKLYEIDTRGDGAPAVGAEASGFDLGDSWAYDEGFEDTTVIWQKGGDRVAPMSMFIGITNVGSKLFRELGDPPAPGLNIEERSNYVLVFGWLDAPQWGSGQADNMRYKVGTGVQGNVGSTGLVATQAYRVIATRHFIEPGQEYHLQLSLKLDTGLVDMSATPGDPDANWNGDGEMRMVLSETAFDNELNPVGSFSQDQSDFFVLKGPLDSIDYLLRYGVRYSGRDATFLGLGMRNIPRQDLGFIATGNDAAALEMGGHRMLDRSSVDSGIAAIGNNLLATHTLVGDSFVEINHDGMSGPLSPPSMNFGRSYTAPGDVRWGGLSGSGSHNADALRGYSLILDGGATSAALRGARIRLGAYSAGPPFQFEMLDFDSTMVTWTTEEVYLQFLRWNQRPMIFDELRIYAVARPMNATAAALGLQRRHDLAGEAELDDEGHDQVAQLIAYWPLDDGEGGDLRELVAARGGALAPFSGAVSRSGQQGEKMLFLSGEGEALTLDLSENPVFLREFASMLESGKGGFAVQVSMVLPEAIYDDFEQVGTDAVGQYGPHLISWETRGDNAEGQTVPAKPLLRFTQKISGLSTTHIAAFNRPIGFQLEIAKDRDQLGTDVDVPVPAVDGGGTPLWDVTAPWVGRHITVQVGIAADPDNVGQFFRYVAVYPKSAFLPEDNDFDQVELAYFGSAVVDPKDVMRSVITIGGSWEPEGASYSTLSARMWVDAVHVFAAAAPGKFPAATGEGNTARNGKIVGGNSFPLRSLSEQDLLLDVGAGVRSGNVAIGSQIVTSAGELRFFDGDAGDDLEAVVDTYLVVRGDDLQKLEVESLPETLQEVYRVEGQSSDRSTMTLATPYNGETRDNAGMQVTRHCGYTAFDDLSIDQLITLGRGKSYVPGTTTSADVTLTGRLVANLAPFGGEWVLRIYSPLGSSSAFDVVPSWVRGLKIPRHNPVTAMESLETRLFAGAASSFCEVDDRWRDDTPRPEGRHSLQLLGGVSTEGPVTTKLEGDALLLPTQGDMVALQSPPAAAFLRTSDDVLGFGHTDPGDTARARYTEFWVKLDTIGKYQTVLWTGSMIDNPESLPGETFYEHKVNRIIRFADGRPELVLPSSATFDGTNRPEKGLFICTADATLKAGAWTHIRWQIGEVIALSGMTPINWWISDPLCWVNGKQVTVTYNTRQDGLFAPRLMQVSMLIESELATSVMAFGVARDSYLEVEENGAFVADVVGGIGIRPTRRVGWMHALAGRIVGFAEGTSTGEDVFSYPNFVPKLFQSVADVDANFTTSIPSHTTIVFAALNEGVGHRPKIEVHDIATAGLVSLFAVIRGNPFLSLAHNMGRHGLPFSMTTWANQIYAANGGRPVYYDTGRNISRFVGLLPPTNKPKFEVIRKPLWVQNQQILGDPTNDPFPAFAGEDDDDLAPNHYSNFGNNYLQQPFDDEMRWERDDTAVVGVKNDIFAFKCLFMLRDTTGRNVIYEQRESLTSGALFIEVRDGKPVIGWYDTYDKSEASLALSQAIIKPGRWYYLYFRKRWPAPDANSNWSNPIYHDLAESVSEQVLADSLVIRQFPLTDSVGDGTGTVLNETTYDAKGDVTGSPGYLASTRNSISFTTLDSSDTDNIFTLPGRVTETDLTVTTPGGTPTADFTALAPTVAPFHSDMWGMLFVYKSGMNQVVGRIIAFLGSGDLRVESLDGVSALPPATREPAAVCFGFKLVPNATFAASHQPDEGTFPIRVFGSPLALQPTNGVRPFNGEFGSFGYVSFREDSTTPGSPGSNPEPFHDASSADDVLEIGTDIFANHIFRALGSAPGNLLFTVSGTNFTVIQSTQPNEDLEVEQSGQASVNAESLFWKFLREIQLLNGSRRIFLTFFDPVTRDESGPGPELAVNPASEDFSNPSGDARFVLTELPVSRDGSGLWRLIYMTLVDGQVPQLVQTIKDNTSSSTQIVKSEGQIQNGRPLDFLNRGQVRAGIIAVGPSRMFFAAIPGEESLVIWSEAYAPRKVPINNFAIFATGDGAVITGMSELNGRMIIFKEHGFVAELLASEGQASDRRYPTDAGCSAHNTIRFMGDRIIWRDSRGIWSMVSGGRPELITEPMRDYFLDDEDSRVLVGVGAAVNAHRRQYVTTSQRKPDLDPAMRIAAGIGDSGVQLALYRTPSLVSLAALKGLAGGPRRLMGGDIFGFVYELDRSGSNSMGIGPQDGYASGGQVVSVVSGHVAASNKPIEVEVKATFEHDEELSGPRGVEMRWLVEKVEKRATAIFLADSGTGSNLWIMPDRTILTADLPAAGTMILLGTPNFFWESKWFDLGTPTQKKKMHYLDIFWAEGSTGEVLVSIFKDFEPAAFQTSTMDIDQSIGTCQIPMERGDGAHLKVRIERVFGLTLGTDNPGDFDTAAFFTSLVLRTQTQDLK